MGSRKNRNSGSRAAAQKTSNGGNGNRNGGTTPPQQQNGELPPSGRSSLRYALITVGALVLVSLAVFAFLRMRSGGSLSFAGTRQPNVILVTIDTLRADCVGFSGHSQVKTPYLDHFAAGGIYFENAHAHNVVTFPSHTNILTGLLPFQHGVRDNAGFVLDPKHKTVAWYMKQAGYATGAFVSAYPLDERFGLAADFDTYDDKYPEGSAPTAFIVPERPGGETIAAAQKWWDSVPQTQKKFMWLHIYEPHAPYNPRSPFKEQYPGEPYFGEVASADDYVGRFLEPILEKNPDTLLIITGDHGEGRGEHGEVTHGLFAYEETLKIPLIVYEKGYVKARREKRFVRHIDIVPTILARIGVTKPAEMKGESLLDLEAPRDTYFESLTSSLNLGWAPLVGMIHQEHKYIDLPIAELYDLTHDPGEKKNILTEDRRMTTRIRELLAKAAPTTASAAERNISPDEAKNLMSLGYLTGTAAAKKTYTADDDPKNLVEFYSRMNHAVTLYQHGQWNEAVEVSRKLLKERPEMTMAKDLMAFMLTQTEKTGQAEKLLRDSIAAGTASDTMKKRLGLLLAEKGEASEAVQILSQFADSKDPDLLNSYGIALADLGRVPDAVEQFQKALQLDATNATAYQNLGVVALRTGDIDRAQQYLSHALQLNAKMPLALNSMGVVFARRNQFPQAVAAWKRAVAIDPRQFDALFNIGLVSADLGQRDDARKALEQFVKTAPPERYASDISKAKAALNVLR